MLAGANTGTAPITVNTGGELSVSQAGTLASTPTVTVNAGGTALITDNNIVNSAISPIQRFGGNSSYPNTDTNISLNGGTFSYVGASGAASTDYLGSISLIGGNSIIDITPTGGGSVALEAAVLTRVPGSTVTFNGAGLGAVTNALTDTATNELLFNSVPKTEGNSTFDHIGILPYASINGTDFATYLVPGNTNDPTLVGLSTFNDYAGSIASANPGDVVKETQSETLTSNVTIAGLVLTNAASVSQAGFSLTIGSNTFTDGTPNPAQAGGGGPLANGSGGYGGGILNFNVLGGTISGGTLSFAGTGEGIILNGLVPGELAANFYNVPEIEDANNNAYGGNILGNFGEFNFNSVPTNQRLDPEINYPDTGTGVLGSGGTNGGILSAGGNGQPITNLPAGLTNPSVAVQWTGYLNIVNGGLYSIINNVTDDDSLTYIDGQLVIFGDWEGNNGYGGAGTYGNVYAASVYLTPGLHSFLEQYDNAGGTGGEVIEYSGPDTGNFSGNPAVLTGLEVIPPAANLTSPGFVATGQVNILSTIGGADSLTMAGGQVNLPTTNSYTGATYVNGANIDVGNNQSLGTGTLNLASGYLQSSAEVTLANPFILNNSSIDFVSIDNLTLSGNGTLAGSNSLIEHSTSRVVLSGVLSDAAGTTGSLVISQTGNVAINTLQGESGLVLAGANTYSGGTTLLDGSLLVTSPTTSNTISPLGTGPLTLVGGTLFVDSQARTLANPIVLDGSVSISTSGFGLTNNTNTAANSSLTFSGAVTVESNSTVNITGNATFSSTSSITGTGQLTVTGQGTLTLSGSASGFSGGVVLNAGVFGAFGTLALGNNAALGTGPLTFDAGQLSALSAFASPIANPIVFTSGSYADFAGTNALTFTNANTAASLVPNSITGIANLIVNVPTTFNEILTDGTSSGTLALFSGTSTLTLTAADSFSGGTLVNSGTLLLKGGGATGGQLTETSGLTIDSGGTVTVDDTTADGGNQNGRINPAAVSGLTLAGGTLNLLGGSGGSTESFTSLNIYSGNSTIFTNSTGGNAIISAGSLTRNSGATANFQAATGQLMGSAADQVNFSTAPTSFEIGGILPFATVTDANTTDHLTGGGTVSNTAGYNLATLGANGITALTTYQTLSTTGGNSSTDNVLVTATPATGVAAEAINSLFMLGDGINISGATPTTALTLVGGTVASTDPVTNTPVGNTLTVSTLTMGTTAAPAEGIIFTNAGSDTIASRITGSQGLTMSGPGSLTLPSANAYTSPTSYDEEQELTLPTTATAGTFQVVFNGTTSANIGFNANANSGISSIQFILQAMNTVGANNVLVTGPYNGVAGQFLIQFVNGLGGQVVPLMTINNNLQPAGQIITNIVTQIGTSATAFNGGTLTIGTSTAIQQGLAVSSGTIKSSASIAIAGTVSFGVGTSNPNILPSSGNVTFGGSNPITLAGGAVLNGLAATLGITNTAATLISGTIGSNPLLSNAATNPNGTLFTTSLIKQGAGTLQLTAANSYQGTTWIQAGIVNVNGAHTTSSSGGLTVDDSFGLAGNEVQTILFTGTITGGSFTLTFNGETTGPIPWTVINPTGDIADAPGSQTNLSTADLSTYVQGALDTLPNIGFGNTADSVGGTYSTNGASTMLITIGFQNQLAAEPLPQITVNTANLPGSIVTVTTTVPGNSAPAVVIGTAGSPATLQLQSGSSGMNLPYRLTIAGSGVTPAGATAPIGVINGYDGNNTVSGPIDVLSASTIAGTFPIVQTGVLQGGGDLTKLGTGLLSLGGDSTWTGGLTVAQGYLQSDTFANALGANVTGVTVLNGATLQLGPGNEISGKPLTLNGNGFGLVQLAAEVVPAGALELPRTDQGELFSGDIYLASNTTIDSNNQSDGSSTATSNLYPLALFGTLSGPGALTKVGLSATELYSSDSSYTAPITVESGAFIIGGSGTVASSSITVDNTSTFILDDTYTVLANRFTGNLTMEGGTFSFLPNNTPGAVSTEALGTITVAAGINTFSNALGSGSNDVTTITAASLVRIQGATATFNQASTGTTINNAGNEFLFTTPPTNLLVNGIFPWMTVNGGTLTEWGTYVVSTTTPGLAPGIEAYSNYVTSLSLATSTSNVELTNTTQLSSNIAVNSLLVLNTNTATSLSLTLGNPANVTANYTLGIGSGGLLTTGAGTTTFTGGTINFGSAEGILIGGSSDTITSVIAGTNGLTDSNTGTVTFGSVSSAARPSTPPPETPIPARRRPERQPRSRTAAPCWWTLSAPWAAAPS